MAPTATSCNSVRSSPSLFCIDSRGLLVASNQILGRRSPVHRSRWRPIRRPGTGGSCGGVVGLQQPFEPAAIQQPARLDLPDADSSVRSDRAGHPRVTPRERGAAKRIPDSTAGGGGAYDDGTRRTEILRTAASLIASSGLRTSCKRSPTRRASCREAFTITSNRRKRFSSSWSGGTTPTWTASAKSPTRNWTRPTRALSRTRSSSWDLRSRAVPCSTARRCRCRSTRRPAPTPNSSSS